MPGEKLFLVSVMKIKEMICPTYCCQLTVKIYPKLYPEDQVLEDQTYGYTHTFFTSLQEQVKCQERPQKISQDAHFAWHPDCNRDKSRMPVEQFNKIQACSDGSLEQSFSCLQFLLKDLLQEKGLEI